MKHSNYMTSNMIFHHTQNNLLLNVFSLALPFMSIFYIYVQWSILTSVNFMLPPLSSPLLCSLKYIQASYVFHLPLGFIIWDDFTMKHGFGMYVYWGAHVWLFEILCGYIFLFKALCLRREWCHLKTETNPCPPSLTPRSPFHVF